MKKPFYFSEPRSHWKTMGFVSTFFVMGVLCFSGCSTRSTPSEVMDKKTKEMVSGELVIVKRLLTKGEANQAWQTLRPLARAHPNQPDILNMAGLTHLSLNNNLQAARLFHKAFKLKPRISVGLNLSSAYIALKKYEKSRRLLKFLISKSKRYRYRERLWHNLALTYEEQANVALALVKYKKALQINPGYVLSLLRVAGLYKGLQKIPEAVDYYAQASKYCRTCFKPVNELVTFHLNNGRYDSAIRILNQFIRQEGLEKDNIVQAKSLLSLAKRVRARTRTRYKS